MQRWKVTSPDDRQTREQGPYAFGERDGLHQLWARHDRNAQVFRIRFANATCQGSFEVRFEISVNDFVRVSVFKKRPQRQDGHRKTVLPLRASWIDENDHDCTICVRTL